MLDIARSTACASASASASATPRGSALDLLCAVASNRDVQAVKHVIKALRDHRVKCFDVSIKEPVGVALDAHQNTNAALLLQFVCSCCPLGSRMQACRKLAAYTARSLDFDVLASVIDDTSVWRSLCSCRDALYVICVAALQVHQQKCRVPVACNHVVEVVTM